MLSEKKKILVAMSCLLCMLAIPCEAKAVTVTKITDGKATQAYVKQVEELREIVKQTSQLQSQLENMRQSLEHFDFKNLDQSYNFLMNSLNSIESIQNKMDVIGGSVEKFEEDWNLISGTYKSEDLNSEVLQNFEKAREERLAKSNKLSAQIAGIINPKSCRESLQNIKQYMSVFESGKTSPVKAVQALSGLVSQQIAETKSLQAIQAEELRRKALEEQIKLDQEALAKAELKRQSDMAHEALESLSAQQKGTTYKNAVMNKEDFEQSSKK